MCWTVFVKFSTANPATLWSMWKEVSWMNMQENYRLIEALESAGWTAQEIVNLIKYIESGDEQYKPKKRQE